DPSSSAGMASDYGKEYFMSTSSAFRKARAWQSRVTPGLSDEQLLTVPAGHRNNILWDMGHIVVIQQLLVYKLSGLELHVPDSMVAQFRNETSPGDWSATPDIALVRKLQLELPEQFEADQSAGLFKQFMPYTTSTG